MTSSDAEKLLNTVLLVINSNKICAKLAFDDKQTINFTFSKT